MKILFEERNYFRKPYFVKKFNRKKNCLIFKRNEIRKYECNILIRKGFEESLKISSRINGEKFNFHIEDSNEIFLCIYINFIQ